MLSSDGAPLCFCRSSQAMARAGSGYLEIDERGARSCGPRARIIAVAIARTAAFACDRSGDLQVSGVGSRRIAAAAVVRSAAADAVWRRGSQRWYVGSPAAPWLAAARPHTLAPAAGALGLNFSRFVYLISWHLDPCSIVACRGLPIDGRVAPPVSAGRADTSGTRASCRRAEVGCGAVWSAQVYCWCVPVVHQTAEKA